MKMSEKIIFTSLYVLMFLCFYTVVFAQTNQQNANGVTTYINPVQPGDHPDQTIMRVGNDFYSTGSNFHFNPYVCIVHSTDLVHWEVFSRVVPSNWANLGSDATSAGTWQGALAYFGGYYWVYFSNNAGGGQYFCKATTMAGPWSTPTKMTGADVTGYDNSIFVDEDGTPYMLLKQGQSINRMVKVDKNTGHQVAGSLMNMDWVNANNKYSWAEGPVMCKRNGRYYYFMAGDVSGGQYCMSSATLTATESAWTMHGNFFSNATSPGGYTGPNHVSQPIMLDDGTWWCISHAYDNSGWRGQGRQCLLHQVNFDANGVPKGVPANTNPVSAPNLPNTKNVLLNLPKEDYFTANTLDVKWHFFNKTTATKYSLTASTGNLRLTPGTTTTHILQKEGGHYYSMITKVNVNATAAGNQAGLRIMNGKDDLFATLYSGYNGAKKIGFAFNGTTTEVNNTIGNVVWLKIERALHNITGYYSTDGLTWTQVGGAIDVSTMDNYNTNYNEWVGTSVGLYATGVSADFDLFKYKDGLSANKIAGFNNFFGTTTSTKTPGTVVSNGATGDWCMLGGISMSQDGTPCNTIEVNAASVSGTGSLEVWIDNISGLGTKIATIPITASGGADVWKNYTANINVTGQHDLYFKFIGAAGIFSLNTVRFKINPGAPVVSLTAPANAAVVANGKAVTVSATASDPDGTVSKVEFYAGTTLIGTDNTSPYSISWTPTIAGSYSITAKVTDNAGNVSTSNAVSISVRDPQSPYGGTPAPIPGTIQFENFDLGGQDSAYYDNSLGSDVTPVVNFRTTEDVDIETCTDVNTGYNLGFTAAGEWLEYTVNVAAAGTYNVTFRVACSGDARTLSLQAKGVTIAKDVAIPNTTGWQTWTDVVVNNITLDAGVQILRLTIGATDYINLNYMTFASVSPLAPTVTSPLALCQGTTETALTATGTALKWYTVPTGGTGSTTAPIPTTLTVGSTTYYVSQTVNGIESDRASINVNVSATPVAPTVISPVNYNQNATATVLTATGTALKWYTVATAGTALVAAPTPSTTATGTVNYYVSQTVNTCESPRATIAVITTTMPPKEVVLQVGWNVIGCPITGSTDIATALSSIWTNVETVKNLDVFYSSVNPPAFNSLTKLDWGQGYLVKVKAACTLTWK